MWRAPLTAHDASMQMNMITAQTYVADHRARLLDDAHRSASIGGRRTVSRLFASSGRLPQPGSVQSRLAPAAAR